MIYRIEWSSAALRQVRKLDEQVARRVLRAVTALAADPRPVGVEGLSGQPRGTMRIRVGNYRVVYVIDDSDIVIVVARVAHRREVYRKL